MLSCLLPVCLAALALTVAPAEPPLLDDALVAEFRVYYDKDKTPEERREAILTLQGSDSAAAIEALSVALDDDEYLVRRAAVDVMASMSDPAGAQWLVDEILEDRKRSKDKLLVAGVIEVLGGMGHALARGAIEEYLGHRDLGIRLGAVNGLARLGDPAAAAALAPLMEDDETAVIVATLKALSAIDAGEQALPSLQAGLLHVDKTVRLAAVEAALRLRLRGSVRTLIGLIDADPDSRVQEDALEVLQTLTQRTFEDDSEVWMRWWDRNETRFEMPDLEKLAEARKKILEQGSKYSRGKTFQGIQTKSEHIVFVIDVSKSMEESFGDPERLKATGRTYDSLQRLAIVKEELINTIAALPETTEFNIVAFATKVEVWKRKLTRANILNKNNATTWVSDLEPRGGGGAGFRSRMGLESDAAEGQTNTHLALMTAFGEDVEDERTANTLVTETKEAVDTVFFLTDGEPTVGKTVDMSEIREEVRRVNSFRGVQIHVIYVGTYGGKEFRKLAEENGGVFVSVGG